VAIEIPAALAAPMKFRRVISLIVPASFLLIEFDYNIVARAAGVCVVFIFVVVRRGFRNGMHLDLASRAVRE
jgi:hypothetical protein